MKWVHFDDMSMDDSGLSDCGLPISGGVIKEMKWVGRKQGPLHICIKKNMLSSHQFIA